MAAAASTTGSKTRSKSRSKARSRPAPKKGAKTAMAVETGTSLIAWLKREEEHVLLVNLSDRRVTFASNLHSVKCEARSTVSVDWAYAVLGGLAGAPDVTVWVQGHKDQKALIEAGECYKWDGENGEHVTELTQEEKDILENKE